MVAALEKYISRYKAAVEYQENLAEENGKSEVEGGEEGWQEDTVWE